MTVRVRFAPSPTGRLHVGNARTALVNWLHARHHGGRFLLRIEDTDPVRSSPELAAAIVGDLEWLGLRWDEGPVHQSQARAQHARAARGLVESGRAYRCFCSAADLDAERRRQEAEHRPPRYGGRCRAVTVEEAERRERGGERPAVRLRMPSRPVVVEDLVHGRIVFDGSDFDDFLLLRADGSPSYHLAVVVDDQRMGITHVIRGDDHLPNTPRHIALAEALGHSPPCFAHLPLIVDGDGIRGSRRPRAPAPGVPSDDSAGRVTTTRRRLANGRQGGSPEGGVRLTALYDADRSPGDRGQRTLPTGCRRGARSRRGRGVCQ